MSKHTTYFSKSELRDYQRLTSKHGPLLAMRKIFVDYAREQGGLTLDVWRLRMGPWFGEPQVMSLDAVAEALGVPVSEVSRVLEETHAAVSPKLREQNLGPKISNVMEEVRDYARKHGAP